MIGKPERTASAFICMAVALAVLAIVGCTGRGTDEADPVEEQPRTSSDPAESEGYQLEADLPEYLSGEGVSWIENWPWIQTSGLCGEEVTSDFEELASPGHGLRSNGEPSAELRRASSYLGLEWEDWEGRWFDRNSVTLFRRTPWTTGRSEFAGGSLYLIYHGDPPRWDEAQSSVLYECDQPGSEVEDRLLPPPIYVNLDGERVDVRYGAVLALINPTRLPGVDLEANCVWMYPGSIDHRYGRRQAKPHGLAQGRLTVSDLPSGLRIYIPETFEHLWATEHRVMAFTRMPRQGRGFTNLVQVLEYGLFEDEGEERWHELASGSVWECGD